MKQKNKLKTTIDTLKKENDGISLIYNNNLKELTEKKENFELLKNELDNIKSEKQKNNRDDRDQNGEEEKVKENDNK